MDPEIKKMIEENLALARENNTMLKKLHSAHRRAMIYRFVYWAIILGITFGAYYFIQPYIETLLGYYGKISGLGGDGDTDTKINTIKGLFDQFQN